MNVCHRVICLSNAVVQRRWKRMQPIEEGVVVLKIHYQGSTREVSVPPCRATM